MDPRTTASRTALRTHGFTESVIREMTRVAREHDAVNLAQGFADAAPWPLTRRTVIYAGVTSVSYFLLQIAAYRVTAGALPPTPAPGPLEWALIVLALVSFGVVALAQATFPLWAPHPAAAGIRVHLSNGLYANALFDRLLDGWSTRKST